MEEQEKPSKEAKHNLTHNTDQLKKNVDDARESDGAKKKAEGNKSLRSPDSKTDDGQPIEENSEQFKDFEHLLNVKLNISVKVCTINISLKEFLDLSEGSNLDLKRSPGEFFTLMVNDYPVAVGNLAKVEDRLGFRVIDVYKEGK